ncbi:MAG: hypothetical protein KIS68_03950 [Bauldia sp.]|nr:hypothetical protein [Bauldia sp.]
MNRALRIVLAGLLGAVIVHLVVILLFPAIASNDVWRAMDGQGADGRFAVLPQPEAGVAERAYLDPMMVHAVCRFDGLGQAPVRVVAVLEGVFWSAAVFDRRGRNLFSVNDRTAAAPLDLLIVGPADLSMLQRIAAAVLEESVVVDVAIDSGLVVLRAFAGDPTMLPELRTMLAAADCNAPIDLTPVPEPVVTVPAEADAPPGATPEASVPAPLVPG